MIVTKVITSLQKLELGNRGVDYIDIRWYEMTKKIQLKATRSGESVGIRFLQKGQTLHDGDVLFKDEKRIVAVNVLPADALVVQPKSICEISVVCYEIGNKHLPLFIDDNKVLMPYSHAMEKWLAKHNYTVKRRQSKLLERLNANVEHYKDGQFSDILFNNKIKISIQ